LPPAAAPTWWCLIHWKTGGPEVYVAGKLVARDGALLSRFQPPGVTPPRDTLQMAPLNADDFVLRVPAFVTASPACAISAARASPSGEKSRCRSATAKFSCPPALA
jgi:hypothetical protein